MDPHVHKILQDAGAAKGLTQDEVFMMMTLGSDELLSKVIESLGEALKNKEITVEEYHESINALKSLSVQYRNAHQGYLEKVKEIDDEESVQTVKILQEKLDTFLSASS
ncbi:hypothetical protein IPN35_06390 [Candidatus Peregrinibacteria bacterium]|nr:MAG: hypothetical protein IPN35_06390 [Candidatus Peregrinibacteria bacterium]